MQTYIFRFNEFRSLLEKAKEIETESFYQTLNELLDDFISNDNIDDKKIYSKLIRLVIYDNIFKLRKLIDNRNTEVE